jgi:prolyl-tRNA editing enzyme YbaK/EbsC (Cys-tRNA(Pro) deacylase)
VKYFPAEAKCLTKEFLITKDEGIAFNAGSHTELIKLAYKDFEALVKPKVIKCCT